MHCGDEFRALNQQTLQPRFDFKTWEAVIDDGAYYANFYGWGKQERTIALLFTGALFNEAAILLTNTPDTAEKKLPFIRKDVTPTIIEAAFRADRKLACVGWLLGPA